MKAYSLFVFIFCASAVAAQKADCNYQTFYYPDKTKREEGCLENGKRVGQWNDYREGTNTVRFIWTYVEGVKHGPYKALYEDGSVEAAGRYADGTLDDSLKMYNKKGELVEIGIWKAEGDRSTLVKTIRFGDVRADGTVDVIDGKIYMWMDGKKVLVDELPMPEEEHKKKKKRDKRKEK